MAKVSITGDWHLDGTEESRKHVKKWVNKMKGTSLILMGDLIDSGISSGMNWNQNSVSEQITHLQEILKRRKVLGYVLGNHEMRIWRQTGLNPYLTLLGKEKDFYEVDGKTICVAHGTRVPQDVIRQLRDLASIHPKADLCALGHNHELVSYINYLGQWLVRTGHLQCYPDYAKRAMLLPKVSGYIEYDTKRDDVKIITQKNDIYRSSEQEKRNRRRK